MLTVYCLMLRHRPCILVPRQPVDLYMGAWSLGLYSGEFASDLKTTIAAVCRLPLDDEALVGAVCQSE